MPHPELDRSAVRMKPLAGRENKKFIERDHVPLSHEPRNLSAVQQDLIAQTAERILGARRDGKPVMLTFGAHTIKNGLAPVLIELISRGWVTHLATNGAGIIHDWEFAYLGQSSEDVRANVARGEFGNWQEAGFYINLAINVGACEGRGYGEAVGAFIENESLTIPPAQQLEREITDNIAANPSQAAAAAELLAVVKRFDLKPGVMALRHPFKRFSVQAAAFRLGVPSTGHPMIGHDIIYNHPMNNGALLGRAALRDFLVFAGSVSRLDGGVYMSLGSAVMSPMIFEKSLSMAQNLAIQQGRHIDNHFILVADLAASNWDWTRGEPPDTSPDYYLRYNKSFARMGGTMRYLSIDNRDFLMALCHKLN
ncbi:MAG: hypothetical protein NTY46_08140 [Candidatus Sumerlaeota bacterium]|nr:hypothetical protein [Candidatus Sumerlaeota bacterium]